jgi:CRISPR-associated helicase Cas3
MLAIEPVVRPLFAHPRVGRAPLLAHQWHSIELGGSRLLSAGTGEGKTLAAFLPAFLGRGGVIAAYPTNALLHDQANQVSGLAREWLGVSAVVALPHEERTRPREENELRVYVIDGNTLELSRSVLGCRTKGEVLSSLIDSSPGRRTVLLTNPDTLHLLASLAYRDASSCLAKLASFGTLILDEIHLHQGLELARLVGTVWLLMSITGARGGLADLVILSATQDETVAEWLRSIWPALANVNQLGDPSVAVSGYRQVIGHLIFRTEPVTDNDDLCKTVCRILRGRQAILRADARPGRTPALILLDSVVNAVRLEHRLVEDGWLEGEIGSVRGLMAQRARSWDGRIVVVGTSAAEVGLDLDARFLLFEGSDFTSFVQRLGRAGRRADSEAVYLDRAGIMPGFGSNQRQVARREFLDLVAKRLPPADSGADVLASEEAVLAAYDSAERLLAKVGDEQSVQRYVSNAMASLWERWAVTYPDAVHAAARIQRDLRLAQRGRGATNRRWLGHFFEGAPSLRGSSPSVQVHDRSEVRRGRPPEYDADLRTLVLWAAGVRWTPRGVLEIDGYEDAPHRWLVALQLSGGDESPGHLFFIAREADVGKGFLTARLVTDRGGCFPAPFPTKGPLLARIATWERARRVWPGGRFPRAWPMRGQPGTAATAGRMLLFLGDDALLLHARLRRADSGD